MTEDKAKVVTEDKDKTEAEAKQGENIGRRQNQVDVEDKAKVVE